jgi:regulator of replication initiation timing
MRPLPFLLGLSLLAAPLGLGAAEIDAEDFRRLADRVNSHDEAFDAYRNTIQDLRTEVARLRAENDRLRTQVNTPRNYATQEQITKLADQIREVEKNRTADKQQFLDAFEKLKSLPPTVVVPPPSSRPKTTETSNRPTGDKPTPTKEPATTDKPTPAAPELPGEFYEHTLGEGETLSAVIDAYNKEHGLKVRLAQVLKANPAIKDPKKLRQGQKIRIPVVK